MQEKKRTQDLLTMRQSANHLRLDCYPEYFNTKILERILVPILVLYEC